MLAIFCGSAAPVSISRMSSLRSSSARGSRSSPSTTATLSVTPAASQAFSTASRQACGFTPPALVMTLIFFSAISRASGAMTTLTKSVA